MPILIVTIAGIVLIYLTGWRSYGKGYKAGRDSGYDEGWDDAKADAFAYFEDEDSTILYGTDLDVFHREQAEWLAKQLRNSPLTDGSEQ